MLHQSYWLNMSQIFYCKILNPCLYLVVIHQVFGKSFFQIVIEKCNKTTLLNVRACYILKLHMHVDLPEKHISSQPYYLNKVPTFLLVQQITSLSTSCVFNSHGYSNYCRLDFVFGSFGCFSPSFN